MIIYVDIDGTICDTPINEDGYLEYIESIPIVENINKINQLYEENNTIIYWTARGTITTLDWTYLTESQLQKWGAKYHQLLMGKPFYGLLIDDKACKIEDINNALIQGK